MVDTRTVTQPPPLVKEEARVRLAVRGQLVLTRAAGAERAGAVWASAAGVAAALLCEVLQVIHASR